MDPWKLEPARDHGLPLPQRMRSLRRESGLASAAAHVLWWSMIRTYLGVVHRLRVEGRHHLPLRPPFVIVSNHSSHLDVMVLAAALGRHHWRHLFPLAAGDTFFESPMTAVFAGGVMNALPMWRRRTGPHAMRELRERLTAEPCIYILFPEGTRSRSGEMGKFRPGLGMLVAGTDVPVVPCRLRGTFQAMPPDQSVPRPHPIGVRVGAPMTFEQHENARPGWDAVAAELERAVRAIPT